MCNVMTGDHYVFIRNMALKSPQTGWAVVHNVFCWWNFCKVLRFTEVQVQWLTGHQTMVLGYNDSLLCARNGETSSSFFPHRKNRFRPLGISFGCVVVAWGSNTVGLEDVLMTFDEYVEHVRTLAEHLRGGDSQSQHWKRVIWCYL